MSNAIFEQYGYASARDLMTELARDISDGGDLIFVERFSRSDIKFVGWHFDGGYWAITYKSGSVVSIDYCKSLDELSYIMGV